MSDSTVSRKARDFDIVLATSASGATTLDMRDMASAIVSFNTMSTNVTSVEVFVSPSRSGTFSKLYKADGSAVVVTLAPSSTEGRSYALPADAAAAEFVKLVSSSSDAVGVTGTVMFKS